jgi:adenosyl cobinamide kinase/adenosyl cobinamide phosphate guanylyltransferase
LVLGGIRSGKSGYAEALLRSAHRVNYLATAPPWPDDPEWIERVGAHRARRPAGWRTTECGGQPDALPNLIRESGPGDAVLVDDLGNWVTALCDASGWQGSAVQEPLRHLVAAIRTSRAEIVLVSPEVGLTVVPDNHAARRFVDALGMVNHAMADICPQVVLVAAGQPLWIKGAAPTSLTP